jgi:hypothetical protein
VVAQGADDGWSTLDAEENAVARIADPAEVEVAALAAGDHGESGVALLIGSVAFDSI